MFVPLSLTSEYFRVCLLYFVYCLFVIYVERLYKNVVKRNASILVALCLMETFRCGKDDIRSKSRKSRYFNGVTGFDDVNYASFIFATFAKSSLNFLSLLNFFQIPPSIFSYLFTFENI